MKLKNNRRQHKKVQKPAPDEHNTVDDKTDPNIEELVFALKNLNISKADTADLRNMLKQTFEYRQKMVQDNQNLDLLENFPYFFTNSELVSVLNKFLSQRLPNLNLFNRFWSTSRNIMLL